MWHIALIKPSRSQVKRVADKIILKFIAVLIDETNYFLNTLILWTCSKAIFNSGYTQMRPMSSTTLYCLKLDIIFYNGTTQTSFIFRTPRAKTLNQYFDSS